MQAYQAVVRRDPDASSRAVFRLATLLSYDNRLEEAIAMFRQYVHLEPKDDEGRIALAQTMAWAGQYDAAIALYDTILARDSTYLDASKGIARVLAWRGDLGNSEIRWRALTLSTPRDPSVWLGLAQVLRWSGRPVAAREALQDALAIDANNLEARAQLRWVNVDLAPAVQIDVLPSNDSDHNSATWYAMSIGVRPPWDGRVTFVAGARTASFQAMTARSLGLRTRVLSSLGAGRWTVNGELGFTQLSGDSGGVKQDIHQPTRLIAAAGIHGPVGPRLSVGIGGSRAPFDETAELILHGITATSGTFDASLVLPAGFTLDAGGGVTQMAGGVTNTRRSGIVAISYAISRHLSAAARVRGYDYDTVATDGYFSPRQYLLTEGSLRTHFGADLGWRASADAGLGTQRVRLLGPTTSRLATRASGEIGYQFAPGYSLSVTGSIANLPANQAIDVDTYRWYSFGVNARLLIP
jgi:hypothetical protein